MGLMHSKNREVEKGENMNEENMKRKLDVEGFCIGVDFGKRGENDEHVLINIYVEDDETWFKEMSLSSFWIDDFIKTLVRAKEKLESDFIKQEDGFGYQFKK